MILRDIAAALSAPLEGDGSIEITGIADPAHASGRSELALAMTPESVARDTAPLRSVASTGAFCATTRWIVRGWPFCGKSWSMERKEPAGTASLG